MKMPKRVAVLVGVLLMLLAPYAVPAEKNITDEVTIAPPLASTGRNITRELFPPRYAVSVEQKKAQEMAIIASYALIDYTQSVTMLYRMDGYREINPMLGPKPSRSSLITLGLIGTGLFYIIADNLSDPWRQIFVDSVIATEQFSPSSAVVSFC
jgi:hypothetical protein